MTVEGLRTTINKKFVRIFVFCVRIFIFQKNGFLRKQSGSTGLDCVYESYRLHNTIFNFLNKIGSEAAIEFPKTAGFEGFSKMAKFSKMGRCFKITLFLEIVGFPKIQRYS